MIRMPLSALPSLTWAQVGEWFVGAPLRIILTIALAIVEAHDGSIEVIRSGPDGSTFRITFPPSQPPPGRTSPSS